LVGLNNAAREYGFELSEEHYGTIGYELFLIEMEAEYTPDIPSPNVLLQRMYGNGMNMNVFRGLLEFMMTADAFSEHMRTLPEYSETELNNYYLQNADDLDVFSIRVLPIVAEFGDDETPDYNNISDEILAAARDMARNLADTIETEEDLIAAALDYNDIVFLNPESTFRQMHGENLSELYLDWLLKSDRVHGDITVIDTETGANILFFVSRDANNYYTTSMRQILILRDTVSPADFLLGVDDPDYIAAVELAEKDARERAQWVDGLFTSQGKTEDALLALLEEHSDEATEGGFYEGITKFSYQGFDFRSMKVVPELEEWLFEEGRRLGDSKLIETEAFGFHLMYFTGFGDKLFSHIIADDRMRTQQHNEWLDSITVGEPIKHRAFIFVSV